MIVDDINKNMVIIIIVGIIGTLLFISLIYDEVKDILFK